MKERIPEHLLKILTSIGKTASEIECIAYAIGGFVRDLFLYRTNEDIVIWNLFVIWVLVICYFRFIQI